MTNNLTLLQDWFKSQCNEDWEHTFGIKIETLDNPGWLISIDLADTALEQLHFSENVNISDTDWYSIRTQEKQLIVNGDVNKLSFLIDKIVNVLYGHQA